MIIGKKLPELKRYLNINQNLDFAISHLLHNNLLLIEPGKYELNENVRLIREDYEPRDIEKCYFESYEKYIDVQIVLQGIEGFGYCHINNSSLIVTDGYNHEKDVKKYKGSAEFIFEMVDGSFAIVFPEDIHMPKIRLKQNVFVKKAVYKVKI